MNVGYYDEFLRYTFVSETVLVFSEKPSNKKGLMTVIKKLVTMVAVGTITVPRLCGCSVGRYELQGKWLSRD